MTILEKNQMKEIVWELMQENKAFFREIIMEIITEEASVLEENNREEKVKAIIKNDFKRYENVFKTLA